jgi:hypothetical protein
VIIRTTEATLAVIVSVARKRALGMYRPAPLKPNPSYIVLNAKKEKFMGDLSKNFSLKEYLVSKEHPYLVDSLSIDTPKQNLFLHAHLLLQPIRDYFGIPVKILSGYRNDRLNSKVGGSQLSRHKLGLAADFNMPALEIVFKWCIINLKGRFGELIWYKNQNFIHIALPRLGGDNDKMLVKED